jgi:hypothetical protein
MTQGLGRSASSITAAAAGAELEHDQAVLDVAGAGIPEACGAGGAGGCGTGCGPGGVRRQGCRPGPAGRGPVCRPGDALTLSHHRVAGGVPGLGRSPPPAAASTSSTTRRWSTSPGAQPRWPGAPRERSRRRERRHPEGWPVGRPVGLRVSLRMGLRLNTEAPGAENLLVRAGYRALVRRRLAGGSACCARRCRPGPPRPSHYPALRPCPPEPRPDGDVCRGRLPGWR